MKTLPVHRELRLDASETLAFERAYSLFVSDGRARNRRAFAQFLLSRAAHAFAVASWSDRTAWWAFDLRPVKPEEKAAHDLIYEVNRPR